VAVVTGVLLSSLATGLVLVTSGPGGQGHDAVPLAAHDASSSPPAAGRITFAGTDHRSLGVVTGTASSRPLFGAGPVHFDQDASARGEQLVFTSLRDSPEPQVYLRDANGAVSKLTTGMDAADPELTPDGKSVVFDSAEPGGAGGATRGTCGSLGPTARGCAA
jgi:hypothetical protein